MLREGEAKLLSRSHVGARSDRAACRCGTHRFGRTSRSGGEHVELARRFAERIGSVRHGRPSNAAF